MFFVLLVTVLLSCQLQCIDSAMFAEKYLDSVIPVFHNVQLTHIPQLASMIRQRPYCSLSLRHDNAIPSLSALTAYMKTTFPENTCRIGASTITSIDQVVWSVEAGAQFISTKDFLPEVLQYCMSSSIPMLCAVKSMKESVQAIELGATVLKVYPSAQMYEYTFQEIAKLRKETRHRLNILASGGVNKDNLLRFKEYGATHFAIGYDLASTSCSEIELDLSMSDIILKK